MNEREKQVIRQVVKEMKDAHSLLAYWLKDSPIARTLESWIKILEGLLDGKTT